MISGIHGGRRLRAPDTPDTRPVTDRVKESIFSSLGSFVVQARVVDLFAGAGSFGIEALSRGATSVTFVEKGGRALAALDANLSDLGLSARVVRSSVERWVEENSAEFDLVFCDPPWPLPSVDLADLLDSLASRLAIGALVVVTRRSSDSVPEPVSLRIDDERRMGDTRIIRYRLEDRS